MSKKIIWILIILFIVLAGYFWYRDYGYMYYNFYILHIGMPPGYCDPGPC